MKEQILNSLTEALKTKKELLEKMVTAMRRSIDLLEGDNVDDFNSEMDYCGKMIEKIDELDEIIKKYNVSEKEKPAAVLLLEKDIVSVIKLLAEVHMECNNAAEEKLLSFGHQLRALRQKKQGLMYQNEVSRKAAFVDIKL